MQLICCAVEEVDRCERTATHAAHSIDSSEQLSPVCAAIQLDFVECYEERCARRVWFTHFVSKPSHDGRSYTAYVFFVIDGLHGCNNVSAFFVSTNVTCTGRELLRNEQFGAQGVLATVVCVCNLNFELLLTKPCDTNEAVGTTAVLEPLYFNFQPWLFEVKRKTTERK